MAGIEGAFDQAVLAVAKQLEEQVDDEIHRLENLGEDEVETLRKKRVGELRRLSERKQEWLAAGHGEFREIDEKEFFADVKGVERAVCLFFRDSMPCKIMEGHLKKLSEQHIETKFLKVAAEKSPFLTDRLRVWMLPTVAIIKKGKVEDYVVGFDELGGTNDFKTEILEERLSRVGAVFADTHRKPPPNETAKNVRKGFVMQKTASDEDSDFD
ncbi:hypothetical protein BSKO_02347 [Bryopsis sp. KO-2023]|nr:hypothetical protein BSKO_02347 [Bryopsis sp. KO-2023]